MKETLRSKIGHLVEPHLVNGVIPAGTYKSTIDKIHTNVVQESIRKSNNNKVLGTPAPKIDPTESSHPADSRCTGTAPFRPLLEAAGLSTTHWQGRQRLLPRVPPFLGFGRTFSTAPLIPLISLLKICGVNLEKLRAIFLQFRPLANFRLLDRFLLFGIDGGDGLPQSRLQLHDP